MAAVLGLTAFGGLLIDAPWQVAITSGLWGGGAAITAALSRAVTWHSGRQRVLLALPYPGVLFGAGLVFDQIVVATPYAVAVGVPAVLVLVRMAWVPGRSWVS